MRDEKNVGAILFVDDDEYCRDIASLIVSNLTNFEIISTHSASTAIDIAQKRINEIKIIFLDILMPDMRGSQIYQELVKNHHLANIPVVFQSGIAENDPEIKELLKLSNVYNLQKPYNKTQLVDMINKLVSH